MELTFPALILVNTLCWQIPVLFHFIYSFPPQHMSAHSAIGLDLHKSHKILKFQNHWDNRIPAASIQWWVLSTQFHSSAVNKPHQVKNCLQLSIRCYCIPLGSTSKCFSSQHGSGKLAACVKNNINPLTSSGYQLHKFKGNMFQRQMLFQVQVGQNRNISTCQLCSELSQPCLRALRNSWFSHWAVATSCAWLQATDTTVLQRYPSTHTKSSAVNSSHLISVRRTAHPPEEHSFLKRMTYS